MTTRTITKVPACLQDIAVGVGKATQLRNGSIEELDKVGFVVLVESVDQLKALPVACKYAAIANGAQLTNYYYHPTNLAEPDNVKVILPNAGEGRWLIRVDSDDYNFFTFENANGLTSGFVRWTKKGKLVTVEIEAIDDGTMNTSYEFANTFPVGNRPTKTRTCLLHENLMTIDNAEDVTMKVMIKPNGALRFRKSDSTIEGEYNGVIQFYTED